MSKAAAIARRRLNKRKSDVVLHTRRNFIKRFNDGQGAQDFVHEVKTKGKTDRNEPLTILPWHEDYMRLIADLRVGTTFTTGAAQCGKTLFHNLLVSWLVCNGKLNTMYGYAKQNSMNKCVPLQFRPVIDKWIETQGILIERSKTQKAAQNNEVFQVNGGNAINTYLSTTGGNGGGAAAGSSVVSLTADVVIIEERSQCKPGDDAPLYKRLKQSRIDTRPVRELGTPGAGLGIEKSIQELAELEFWPHVSCPHCGHLVLLDARGALLRPQYIERTNGDMEVTYFGASGKPEKWFHHDPDNAVETAYIGCPECEGEIDDETRAKARFYDRETKRSLQDYLNSLPIMSRIKRKKRVAIVISPLLRQQAIPLAYEIIDEGLTTSRVDDWHQQVLGIPSMLSSNAITIEMIDRAVKAPKFTQEPDFVIAGMDLGRNQDWLWVDKVYLPEGYEQMSTAQLMDACICQAEFAGPVIRNAVPGHIEELIIEKYPNIDWRLTVDNEPSRESAIDLCAVIDEERAAVADQKAKLRDAVKLTDVKDGGRSIDCWDIRNGKFLRHVLLDFTILAADGHPLARLPDSWESWHTKPTDISPFVHLMSPEYDYDEMKWVKSDRPDHLYYAKMFAKVSLFLLLEGMGDVPSWVLNV